MKHKSVTPPPVPPDAFDATPRLAILVGEWERLRLCVRLRSK